MSSLSPLKPILIVLHQENSTPGRIGLALKARGHRLDVRRPRFGDPLPETMADHAGAVVFGGPMSANDEDAFIRVETDWMAVPLRENAPLLGICLGAQMLCRHLGGRVEARDDARVEIGWHPLTTHEAGRAYAGGDWPGAIYQWHSEGMTRPRGAETLASSEAFGVQAFSYGSNALAVQFHVELTLAMMHRWTTKGAHKLHLPGAQPRAEHFKGRLLHDEATRSWTGVVLDRWLNAMQDGDAAAAAAVACGRAA